jgi:hypothetical protein
MIRPDRRDSGLRRTEPAPPGPYDPTSYYATPTPDWRKGWTNTMPHKQGAAIEPLDDAVDHVRGGAAGRLILEYGDYECPYSRRAFLEIEGLEARLGDRIGFAFRHFPLTEIHPHALAASAER